MDLLDKLFNAPGNELGPMLVAARAGVVFVVAVVFVRMAKKRFIAQASALDLVMAVVFGSMLSRAINGGASLTSCLAAGLAMVVVQRILEAWASRSKRFYNLVKGSLAVLVKNGIVDQAMMRRHALSIEDVMADARLHGQLDDLGQVRLATLERSGEISVLKF